MGRLDGRRALVTGAAAGIGAATVERFRAEGADVVGVDADPSYSGLVADVGEPAEIAAAIRAAGPLDICVANAGVSLMQPFLDGDVEAWERVLRVNVLGVMLTLQTAALAMRGGGRLLVTASIAALHGEPGAAAYCASKAALVGLVRTLARELGPAFTVNAVAPGQVDTRMNRRDLELEAARSERSPEALLDEHLRTRVPAGRLGRPEEIAAAFAYLASDEARFVTGTVLRVDGGELA